ncbi:hypothetical protein [Devosia sp.]|uniref:hypothetical protein n=1 Tax=Devosia sp. TaxID=1871048 RepID=UPI001AC5C3AF|nr:hypothetical protein [Devosia sp.]MBN9311275.1 hypothetical protein [Devosia sp.]
MPALAGSCCSNMWRCPALETGLADGVLRALESVLALAVGGDVAVLLTRLPPMRDVFATIGRHTLPVYVTHGLVIAVVAELLSDFAGAEPWRYRIFPVLVIVSVAGSLLLEAALERLRFPRLYRAPRLPEVLSTAAGASAPPTTRA